MSKIFIVILYIYAALHFFAFGGRTAEVTYDSNGNVIQQVYDRKGNMIGVYDEKGRDADRHGCCQRTENTEHLIAEIRRSIDSDRSWRRLCDGDHIEKLILFDPFPFRYEFIFKKGYHGVTAAKGK